MIDGFGLLGWTYWGQPIYRCNLPDSLARGADLTHERTNEPRCRPNRADDFEYGDKMSKINLAIQLPFAQGRQLDNSRWYMAAQNSLQHAVSILFAAKRDARSEEPQLRG